VPSYEAKSLPAWKSGRELDRIAPYNAFVLAVDEDNSTTIYYSRQKGWHFLEDIGNRPGDSRGTIIELEKRIREVTDYLIFTHSAFWWINYCKDFLNILIHNTVT
jgi:hypothetical protein